MERKIQLINIVRVKDIGTVWMKVIRLDYDFDEDGKTLFLGHLLNIISSDTNNKIIKTTGDDFKEDEHKIYYVICEWYDTNGIRHEEKFEDTNLEKLDDIPKPSSPTIIEGFIKKD